MAAKGRTHLRRSPLAALLRLWARVLLAAISVGALGAAAHARTLATAAAPENSPLGFARNPGAAHVGAERLQAPESLLESAFGYGQLASDSAYAARGANVLKNKQVGDAFRDEIADALKAAGRDVEKEVVKKTPFGPRVIDIEVSEGGKVLGGVETKVGGSRYLPSQRAKDAWLKMQGYPVNVVRDR